MRKSLFSIILALALCMASDAYAQFAGGTGAGAAMAISSSSVVIDSIATTSDVKIIRAGQSVTNVARASGVSTITLSAAYPNNNLKVGQRIVVDVDDNTFDGTFLITWVAADFQSFKYSQPLTNVTSKSATGTAGGHYTSLTAWESAEGGNLVTAAKSAVAECYNDWSSGLNENFVISGNTTSASYFFEIMVPASERNNGSTGTGFRIAPSSGDAFNIADSGGFAVMKDVELIGSSVVSAGATLDVAGNALFTGGISIDSGGTFNAGNSNLIIASSFMCIGTFNAQGAMVRFNSCNVTFSTGTVNSNRSAITFYGDSTWTPKQNVPYNIIRFLSGTATISTYPATISGNLILDTGSSGAVNGLSIILTGNLVCVSGPGGTSTLTLSNTSLPQCISGTGVGTLPAMTINKTTQTLEVGIYGSVKTKNITVTTGTLNVLPGATLTIGAGNTVSLASGSYAKFTGTSFSSMALLRSSTPGTRWNLANASGSTVTPVYTDVQDSNATNNVTATTSINSGNNVKWFFNPTGYIDYTWIADSQKNWSDTTAWGDLNADGTGDLPLSNSNVHFTATHTGNCVLDSNVTVACIENFDYTGTLFINGKTLSTLRVIDSYGITTTIGGLNWRKGTIDGGTGSTIKVAGNLNIPSTATFTPGTSTLELNPSTASLLADSGNYACTYTTVNSNIAAFDVMTFTPGIYNIKSGKSITAGASSTLNFAGTGADNGMVMLRSTKAGTQWNIVNAADSTVSATYVNVKDSNASNTITATSSIDSGNNVNWSMGGALTATKVTPASLAAGAVGNVTAEFSTFSAIPSNGKVKITFPSGFTLNSGDSTAVSGTPMGMSGTPSVSIAGQVITISGVSASTIGAKSIVLTNIKNPTSGGLTGTYSIQTLTSEDVVIDSDPAVVGSLITGALTGASVAHASPKAGATSNTTIAFTTDSEVASGGKIEIDFPTGYDLTASPAYVSGNANSYVTTSGNTITINVGTSISADTGVSIVVSGIKNPILLGSTGSYSIRTKTSAGSIIDEGTASANTIVMPTLAIVTPSDSGISMATGSSYNISWTGDGKISNSLALSYATDGATYNNAIASGLANSGSYSWIVPASTAPGNTNKVKIEDAFEQTVEDKGSANFSDATAVRNNTSVTGAGESAKITLNKKAAKILGTYSTGTAPYGLAFDSATNSIWVVNNGSNTISKFNASTGAKISDYSTSSSGGAAPLRAAFDPVTNSIWVTNSAVNTVSKISVADGIKAGEYNTGTTPYGVAFDSATNSIWVANYGANTISKFNVSTGAPSTFPVGTAPYGVTFDSATNSVWVTNSGANTVSKVSVNTGAVSATYNTGATPYGITFSSATNSIFVANNGAGTVSEIDVDGTPVCTYTTGTSPYSVAFDPVTNSLWTANSADNSVSKHNTSTGARIAWYYTNSDAGGVTGTTTRYFTNSYPRGLVYNPVTESIWAANYNRNTVTAMTVQTGGMSTTSYTASGSALHGIVFEPVTNSIWVSSYSAATATAKVTKFNVSTGAIAGTATGNNVLYAAGLCFDSKTNSVWVANPNTSSNIYSGVTKINVSTLASTHYLTKISYGYNISFDPISNSIWSCVQSNPADVGMTNVETGNTRRSSESMYYPYYNLFESATNSVWFCESYGVYRFNPVTGVRVSGVGIATTPNSIAFDPITKSIWVTRGYSGAYDYHKIDVATSSVIKFGGLDGGAFRLFESATNSVWSSATTSMRRFNVATGGKELDYLVTSFTTQGYTAPAEYDPVNGNIWLLGAGTDVNIFSLYEYSTSGEFISRVFDTGGASGSTFGTITYTAATPTSTTFKLQLAGSSDGSNWTSFMGSDGTSDTYVESGTNIPSALAGYRYIKYKAMLSTTDILTSPSLSEVKFTFTSGDSSKRIISDTSDNNFTITAAQMSTASVVPASLVAGKTGNITASFTTVNAIPADGKIAITLPTGFVWNSGGTTAVTSVTGIDGTLTPSVSGQTLTLTRSGGTASAVGAKSVTLSFVKNPNASGLTGNYTIATQSSAGSNIDLASPITGSTLTNGLTTWDLNMNTGTLILHYGASVSSASYNCAGITIQNAASSPTSSYTLTGGTAGADGRDMTVTLSTTDLNALKLNTSLATGTSDSYIAVTATAFTDLNGNTMTAISSSSALNVTTYTADTTAPALSSWALNMNTHQATLTFNEPVKASTFTAGSFTLQNTATGATKTYSLTNSTTPSSNGLNLAINLSATDFNAIVDYTDGGLCSLVSNSYITMTEGAIKDMANTNIAALTTGVQASSFTANTLEATQFHVTTDTGANSTTIQAGADKGILVKAYDASGYRTPAYTGSKIVIFSGAENSGDNYVPTAKDSGNNSVSFGENTTMTFTVGRGSTTMTLYNQETAHVKATVGSITTDDLYALAATVGAADKHHLVFTTQPSATGIINSALAQQPVVAIRDSFGNLTDDTDSITLWASSSGTDYDPNNLSGVLTATSNPVAAVDGVATFSGVKYSAIEKIYIYASWSFGTGQVLSESVTLSSSASTAVIAAASPQANFNISPINDTLAEKFTVLKFRIQDSGDDGTPTLIDRIKVSVAGTGASASTDVAWAELRADDGGDHQVAVAASIANDYITFGVNPDAQGDSDLDMIPDGATIGYTVNVYMSPTKLTATDGKTYILNTNESLVGVDTGVSSRMRADSGAVTAVIGTIAVTATHLEIVDYNSPNAAAVTVTAGTTGNRLQVRATDINKNIDVDYYGIKTLRFSGLSSINGNVPKIGSFDFGSDTSVSFSSGKSVLNAVNLTAYSKGTENLYTEDRNVDPAYTVFPCAVTVNNASAVSIGLTSGNNQSGLGTRTLSNPLLVTVRDTYTNPVGAGTAVTFAVSSEPVGTTTHASLDAYNTTTNSSGQASTHLTLGNAAGTYQVTATSGTLTGSPVTFNATARVPTTLAISSGNVPTQSALVSQTLEADFVVKLVDNDSQPVSGEMINFAITTQPDGAGASLSSATATTDDQGQAAVRLTLGTKAGTNAYVVTASYGSLTPVQFTASATQREPYKVVLSGPTSVKAGSASAAFVIAVQDQYGNASNIETAMLFDLTLSAGLGALYSDAACTTPITTKSVAAGASSAVFYFKSNSTGNTNVTATTTDTRLNESYRTSSISGFTVLPESMDHFTVTAADTSAMTAGESRAITIKGYDSLGNLSTDMTDSLSVTFTGANTAPSPSGNAPTCSNSGGSDVAFGTPVVLSFSSGVATTTFKAYKAESVSMIATSSGVTTPSPLSLVVKHGAADHLKFHDNLLSNQVAGKAFNFDTTLDAVDIYSNICDGANGAAAYTASGKTIGWNLNEGAVVNGPESGTDVITNPVSFTNGRSTTILSATFYYAQTITITPSVTGLEGINVTSNSITVAPDVVSKLTFSQQPSTGCLASQVFPQQPWVAVSDQYGNTCKSVSAQVTLTGSTTTGSYTPVTNGVLRSTTGLVATTTDGVAKFTGINYTYPENIYIRATAVISGASVSDIYSYMITLNAKDELAVVSLPASSTVSSLANASADKVNVFKFQISDGGSDGLAGVMKKIVINRSGSDTSDDWTQYMSDAVISDGTNEMTGAIEANSVTFGTGTANIYTVPNNSNRTYTLSITLKKSLPVGADGKILGFTLNPNEDITLSELATSTFPEGAASVSSASTVEVIATNLVITGSKTMMAGASQEITITAKDANNNIDLDYDDQATGKSITFSGASVAASGNAPTCTNYTGSAREFGNPTGIYFTKGVSSSTITMTLYKAESAGIIATAAAGGPVSDSKGLLAVVVSGGAGSQLSWNTKPRDKIVANAPWKTFVVAVTDQYGNTASDNRVITIQMPVGISLSPGASNTATAASGLATFNNFAVKSDDNTYPKYFYLIAESTGGITPTGEEDSGYIRLDEKYTINFLVKDSVSAAALSGFKFTAKDVNQLVVVPETTPTTNPFEISLPYGTYTFTFDLDKYVTLNSERGVNVAGDAGDGTYDNVINWTEYMTTLTESTADYRVMTSFAYDEDTETLAVRLWLERRGKMIVNNDINKLGPATIETYEPHDPAEIRLDDINIPAPDSADYTTIGATYKVTIKNVLTATSPFGKALESGKTYFVKCIMHYGGEDGMSNTYEGGTTFTVTVSQRLSKEIISKIGVAEGETLAGKIADVATSVAAVSTKVDTTTAALTSKVDTVGAQVAASDAKISTKVDNVQTTAGAILDGVSTTIPAKIESELAKGVVSEMLTRYTILREDDSVKIRYRTASGLAPTLTIYKPDGTILPDYNGVKMTEISNTGIYEYEVTAKDTWGVGDFTAECSESTKGSKDSMVLTIKALYTPGAGVEESIDAVGEAVSKVYTRQKSVENLLGGTTDTKSASTIFGKVNGLSSTVDGLNLTTVSSDAKNARMNAQNIYNEMEIIKKSVGDMQAQSAAFKELSRQLAEMQANIRKASQNLSSATTVSGGGSGGSTTTIISGQDVVPGSGSGTGIAPNAERDIAGIRRDVAELKKGASTLKGEDVKNLNNRIEELNAMVKLLSRMIETNNNKPVVEGWFEQE